MPSVAVSPQPLIPASPTSVTTASYSAESNRSCARASIPVNVLLKLCATPQKGRSASSAAEGEVGGREPHRRRQVCEERGGRADTRPPFSLTAACHRAYLSGRPAGRSSHAGAAFRAGLRQPSALSPSEET